MFGQIGALVGERGVIPVGVKLAAIRRDFPGPRRFLYFPTLLWLGHGDGALRLLSWPPFYCRTWNSMRRFFSRPSLFLLSAMGCVEP